MFTQTGTLLVNTAVAGGALPISNSVVKIVGASEENRGIEYSVLTDENGVTKEIPLPAPLKSLSEAPNAPEVPYALYNIEVSSDGYYTKKIFDVAVFADTLTVLSVNMIPETIHNSGPEYPKFNLDTYVRENEMLER